MRTHIQRFLPSRHAPPPLLIEETPTPGIRLALCKDEQKPRVVMIMKCRIGNQLHQTWIAQLIREMLNRPLHVIMKETTKDCDVFTSGLIDMPIYDSVEYHDNNSDVHPSCHEVDPFAQLFAYGSAVATSDVIVDVHAECWSLTCHHEDYIRNLYKINNPLLKKDRIMIHLRLGDVATEMTVNTNYINYCLQTVQAILRQQKRHIPLTLLAEDPTHEYALLLKHALVQEFGTQVDIINNLDPYQDFKEVMASSFIIMANSTFSFWAAYLADPLTTQVYAGISSTQPCAHHRNYPLFERGCPANFHIAYIDDYHPYLPTLPTPRLILTSSKLTQTNDVCIATITSKGYVHMTQNMLASLEATKSKATVLVVCLDKESYQDVYTLYKDTPTIIPIETTNIQTQSKESKELQCFGTSGFNKLMFHKLDVVSELIQMFNQHLVYVDSDIVFLKDPMLPVSQLYQELPVNVDVVFQCDEDKTLCNKQHCKNLCAGIMLLKNTLNTRAFLNFRKYCNQKSIEVCPAGDQSYVNVARNLIRFDTLPNDLFPNGSWLPNISKDAVLVHYNWILGKDKVKRMKTYGHWFI